MVLHLAGAHLHFHPFGAHALTVDRTLNPPTLELEGTWALGSIKICPSHLHLGERELLFITYHFGPGSCSEVGQGP